MLILIENGVAVGNPILETNFQQLFSNVSFPKNLTSDDVEPFGYGLYEFSSAPQASRYTKFEEVASTQDGQGVWRQTWVEIDMSEEEIAAVDLEQDRLIRKERNSLLQECDWTQFNDSPLAESNKSVWAVYRQALRDVPAQAGFPWDIDWPELPV